SRAEREVELAVRLDVLMGLQVDEQVAEQERRGKEDVEQHAVARLQRVMRDRDRHARRQQDRRIDGRQAEGRYDLEISADGGRSVGRPARLEVAPEQIVSKELATFPAQPRHRILPRVKE